MFKSILAIALLVSSHFVSAQDFTGHWVGVGSAHSTYNQNHDCNFDININSTDRFIKIESFNYDCGFMQSELGPMNLIIQGKMLTLDGYRVGKFKGDKFKLSLLGPSGSSMYEFKLINGNLTFWQALHDSNNGGTLVTGELSKE